MDPHLTCFADLLAASTRQPEPQRLLFVFASIDPLEDPPGSHTGHAVENPGRSLTPRLCVDKAPGEIADFAALVAESRTTGQDWDIVFVASLPGRAGIAPSADEAAQPLRFMVDAINNGRAREFAAFDREGGVLVFG